MTTVGNLRADAAAFIVTDTGPVALGESSGL
jgi:hypothetical protein